MQLHVSLHAFVHDLAQRMDNCQACNEVPIAPAGPVYEEVDLAMTPQTQDIQVDSNKAYGEVRK